MALFKFYWSIKINYITGESQNNQSELLLGVSLSLTALILILSTVFITVTVILIMILVTRCKTRMQSARGNAKNLKENTTYEEINLTPSSAGGIDTNKNVAYGHLSKPCT